MMEQGREVTRLPDNYTVQKGDSLSTISGQDQIYGNWQLWPLIYDANRTQITKDPDLIYPQQNLGIPRGYSVQEAEQARQRALQKRPPHRLNDGY
jgi:nucleoid-associated protein YgaU